MKKVTIKFMGMGIGDRCQANIKVYDMQHCLVAKGKSKGGVFTFCGKEKHFYQICFCINGVSNTKTIYVNNTNFVYPFYYQGIIDRPRIITFRLTDRLYNNLPISKGEMVLWPR